MNPDELTPQPPAAEDPAAAPAELKKPESDELAKSWTKAIARARKHWEKVNKRIAHNRKKVAGFNWARDPDSQEFVDPRANLIFSTAQATLPNIYARNPDISVTGAWRNGDVRLFCETLETVLSKQMRRAKLKSRMKMSVLSALTEYFGVVKVTYQRDIRTDPLIRDRMNDAQDNLVQLEGLIQQLEDPENRNEAELKRRELEDTIRGLESKTEIVAAEGLVIDRVLFDNMIIDPDVVEFDDYEHANWLAQAIPMQRGAAEALYKVDLKSAKAFKGARGTMGDDKPEAVQPAGIFGGVGQAAPGSDEETICILEIWDKRTQLVHTMADGCEFFCRESYAVEAVGQRWYPYFILPYAVLPGQFVAPCLVDLTEKLQNEHNETRDKFAAHREINKPGWIGDRESIDQRNVTRFKDSVLGEITLVDAGGRALNQVIMPKQSIPVNPADYDTAPIRFDWEQVTGLQDAARSTIVQPKTATEASIMQQSLSGRTAEFRDKLEDLLLEMDEYAAQILLQELTPAQVERYTGPNDTEETIDPMTGEPMPVVKPAYDWPQLNRDQIFDMVEINIIPGTTGAPDKAQSQEIWTRAFPVVQQLITQIMQCAAQGIDYSPLEALLRETLKRFDDRIDVDQFLPKPSAPAAPAAPPQSSPGMLGAVAPDGQQSANDPMAAIQQGGAIPGAPGQAPAIPAVAQ
ncbi:hypothetical protein [Achromobacter dolens]|uniref:hypothetical protein n=1 Tax=Achromobacter dolens TaxID=1287738 RepID=UPI000A79B6D4|nr:hypothetical protein [Achromobacter dolens]